MVITLEKVTPNTNIAFAILKKIIQILYQQISSAFWEGGNIIYVDCNNIIVFLYFGKNQI